MLRFCLKLSLFSILSILTPKAFAGSHLDGVIMNLKDALKISGVSNEPTPGWCYDLSRNNRDLMLLNKDDYKIKELRLKGRSWINDLFHLRLKAQDQLKKSLAMGQFDAHCPKALRSFLRVSRFIEEYLAEAIVDTDQLSDRVFAGTSPALMVSPFYQKWQLRSGDVLLSRGNAAVSAAIARIGEDDGHFSHIALVYVDPKTQKVYTIEAHIEIGVAVADIEKYLSDGKIRAVVYRPADAKIAHLAATTMFERATRSKINYDFAMDMSNQQELFCSEVASAGFRLASPLFKDMPFFKSSLRMKNRSFLKDIGITVDKTFAPGDIELDPRFDLVAEWRQLNKTRSARFLDAILTSLYQWMDDYGYNFENTPIEKVLSKSAWSARKVFLFSPLLKAKFPENMKPSALEAMISLGEVSETLLNEVIKKDLEESRRSGLSFTYFEVRNFLEELRLADYSRFSQSRHRPVSGLLGKRSLFHDHFHP